MNDNNANNNTNDNVNNNNTNNNINNNNTNDLLLKLIDEIKINKVFNTHNNSITKGIVNPVKRITQLLNLHFNSCFRDNYYNSIATNYKYTIPNSGMNNIVSLKLSSIEIPNSWFLFSSKIGNNKFTIEVKYTDSCNDFCHIFHIVLPDGNYDKVSIVNYLNEKYFIYSDNEILKYIEVGINNYTNKFYFKIVDLAFEKFTFSLHFVEKEQKNILETLGWILGFRLASYNNIDDLIQSEGLFDAGGDRYVYLSFNDYQYNYNQNNIVCFDNMSVNENILAKIPLLNGKFSLNVNENDCNPLIKIRQYNAPVNINKVEIKLLDKFCNVINLNNMDWSFSVELEILYKNIL
tara:strand:+ start:44 stop:1090 length:1047 start_codon:yes stop_codon:yes gene_type:complete